MVTVKNFLFTQEPHELKEIYDDACRIDDLKEAVGKILDNESKADKSIVILDTEELKIEYIKRVSWIKWTPLGIAYEISIKTIDDNKINMKVVLWKKLLELFITILEYYPLPVKISRENALRLREKIPGLIWNIRWEWYKLQINYNRVSENDLWEELCFLDVRVQKIGERLDVFIWWNKKDIIITLQEFDILHKLSQWELWINSITTNILSKLWLKIKRVDGKVECFKID